MGGSNTVTKAVMAEGIARSSANDQVAMANSYNTGNPWAQVSQGQSANNPFSQSASNWPQGPNSPDKPKE